MSSPRLLIDGITSDELKAMPANELDALLRFGKPVSFTMGSANILAEFNRDGEELRVNLAHIDGGGEGVLASLQKLVRDYARERGFSSIRWNVHALTCANPNERLQTFLRRNGFDEVDDPDYGRILMRRQMLS